jgi:tRNA pseudouridine38-40 synthase
MTRAAMTRIAIGIEYDGTEFLGWQRLSHGPTVQAAVEQALSFVADSPIEITCAGRTDAGVHAECQVAHFDTERERTPRAWALGATTRLPPGVCVRWACPVEADFHARYSAHARRYRYRIQNRHVRPALHARFVAWERATLDTDRMHAAAQCLIGEHDFSAFRTLACQARSPRRNVEQLMVSREGDIVQVDIRANAFLHHMVRNIVGSLLPIGRGERDGAWLARVLAARDRAQAGPTAAAEGLTFVGPVYAAEFGLPAEVSETGAARRVPRAWHKDNDDPSEN